VRKGRQNLYATTICILKSQEHDTDVTAYTILGLDSKKELTDDEVKRAWRTFSLRNHPDKNPVEKRESATKYQTEGGQAYDFLKSADRRQKYRPSNK
tara:strand:+ start:2336 stop:2626 length:291 start_codon:yes stop_codon:yes gene_type:complete